MSLTSDDRHARDESALAPLFTAEGRRMPRETELERVVGVLEGQDRPLHTSETANSFHH